MQKVLALLVYSWKGSLLSKHNNCTTLFDICIIQGGPKEWLQLTLRQFTFIRHYVYDLYKKSDCTDYS